MRYGKGKTVNATLDSLRLVLASSSRLRQQVVAAAGFDIRAVDPGIKQPARVASPQRPAEKAEADAYFKARAVAEQYGTDECVLGVSTVVAVGEQVFGPPAGRLEAEQMLRALAGTRHAVVTGVAVLERGVRLIASEVTYVTMRQMSEDEIATYLDSGNWIGVPGAYAGPEMACQFVRDVEGSFSNLLGLPVELLYRMLEEIHQHPEAHRHN
jgi:septum formation protein